MKPAAIYARFSTELQNEKSTEDQIALCQRYAARHQWIRCSAVRESGSCSNRRIIYLRDIERLVLSGMVEELKDPRLIETYVRSYNGERERLAGNASAVRTRLEAKRDRIESERQRNIDLVIKYVISEDDAKQRIADLIPGQSDFFVPRDDLFGPEITRVARFAELGFGHRDRHVGSFGIEHSLNGGLQPSRHRDVVGVDSPAPFCQLALQVEDMTGPGRRKDDPPIARIG